MSNGVALAHYAFAALLLGACAAVGVLLHALRMRARAADQGRRDFIAGAGQGDAIRRKIEAQLTVLRHVSAFWSIRSCRPRR